MRQLTSALLYYTVLHYTVLYNTRQDCTVPYIPSQGLFVCCYCLVAEDANYFQRCQEDLLGSLLLRSRGEREEEWGGKRKEGEGRGGGGREGRGGGREGGRKEEGEGGKSRGGMRTNK